MDYTVTTEDFFQSQMIFFKKLLINENRLFVHVQSSLVLASAGLLSIIHVAGKTDTVIYRFMLLSTDRILSYSLMNPC